MGEPLQTEGGPPVFTLSLSGGGLSFTQQISAEQLAGVMALALGVSSPSPAKTGAGGGSGGSVQAKSTERLSLREYLDASDAKKIPEKIVAIALFLNEHEGAEMFSRDDIKSRFRSAGESQPGNFPRDFGVAVSSGWIAEDHAARGSFYVTKTGRGAVESRFAADVARIQRRVSRKRKGVRSAGDGTE